eukprot:TRINITY_DN5141_c0_g1_i2.p1 TRINITY_DN5141_c0_g1~~TRINITY_DN5141_c0_g1_i2.p1  ORF type:complete len:185 (-),score=64.18 TRINITY_DN5141_c0_g1_i2:14-568(-)
MIRRPPRSTQGVSSAASDVYKRQVAIASSVGVILRVVVKVKQNKEDILVLFTEIPSKNVKEQLMNCRNCFNNFREDDKAGINETQLEVEEEEKKETKEEKGEEEKDKEEDEDEEKKEDGEPLIAELSLIHISEPTRPLYISYAVFCLKKKKKKQPNITTKSRQLYRTSTQQTQLCLHDTNLNRT